MEIAARKSRRGNNVAKSERKLQTEDERVLYKGSTNRGLLHIQRGLKLQTEDEGVLYKGSPYRGFQHTKLNANSIPERG
jgi:hypothetical protein